MDVKQWINILQMSGHIKQTVEVMQTKLSM